MNNSKTCLNKFLNEYEKIEIPDIQRDYVMGSGGEKLKALLKSMNICAENKEKNFNFSCIMGYEEKICDYPFEKKKFFVYDGQQRLTTLIFLIGFIILKNNLLNTEDIKEKCMKFEFNGRDEANKYLENLLYRNDQKEIDISDFTTYSLYNLIKTYGEEKKDYWGNEILLYPNISTDFLLNRVEFDLVVVDKMGDAEQFFLDLNDGVDLKAYEIYKAELNHKISKIKDYNTDKVYNDCINNWSLKIDNEWLEYFLPYKTDKCCEEEIEINFIKYCFKMLYVEENCEYEDLNNDNLNWIEKRHIKRIYDIMQNIIKIDISNYAKEKSQFLNFSWSNSVFQNMRGSYWNLNDENYEGMLYKFICSFQKNPNNDRQRKYDVLIWSYISNLDVDETNRNEYLRFIKKLLNANRVINNKAWYTEHTIWYCRYGTFGVPEYYGNKFSFIAMDIKENEQYIWNIISINYSFRESYICNFEKLINALNFILNNDKFTNSIRKILHEEYLKLQNCKYEEIRKFENLKFFNGLVNNFLDKNGELLVSYNDFIKIMNINDENKSINNFRQDLSRYITDFNDFLIDDIIIEWDVRTSTSSENGRIPLQCLIDFFTHCDFKWKDILEKWLTGTPTDSIDSDSKFYLKYYDYIPNSWYNENYPICYPLKGENGSLLSAKSKVYYEPINKIRSIKHWFNSMFYKIISDGSDNIIVLYNNKVVQKNTIPTVINNKYKWLKQLLCEQGYREIYYTTDDRCNNIILLKYIEGNQGGMGKIEKWIKDDNGIAYDVRLNVFDKIYLVSNNSLIKFKQIYEELY